MKNKKKMVIITSIFFFLCILVGIVSIILINQNKEKEEEGFDFYSRSTTTMENIIWIKQGADNEEDVCLIVNPDPTSEFIEYMGIGMIPQKYICLKEAEGKQKFLWGSQGNFLYHWESAKYELYDINTRELVKTIDVKEIMEKELPGHQFLGHFDLENGRNGNSFVSFMIKPIPIDGDKELKASWIYIDLVTEEMYVDPVREELIDDGGEKQKEFEAGFRKKGKWKTPTQDKIGRSFLGLNGEIVVYVPTNKLPKNNEKLYSKFPGLEGFIGEKDKMVLVYFTGYPTLEEVESYFWD